MSAIIVSDTHLGAIPDANVAAFNAFLTECAGAVDTLLINGDLFDFWFEYRSVVPRGHFTTLRRLAEVSEAGTSVVFLGGNHDAWGGDFLRDEVGMEVRLGPVDREVAGWTARIEHGDGVGGGDLGYRALRWLTREGGGASAFRWLHPDLGSRLARRASSTGERHAAGPGTGAGRAQELSDHAASVLEAEPELELVVYGHSHRPELRQVAPGRFYLNTGDWIHHLTYAHLTADRIELRRWEAAEALAVGTRAHS